MSTRGALALTTVLCAALALAGCGGRSVAAEIITFEPLEGILSSGNPAMVSVRVKNTGTEGGTFWIGLSVQDLEGEWYDAPPSSVELESGEESGTRELSTEPLARPGYYKTRVSVWENEPEEGKEGARLAAHEEASAFRVSSTREDFDVPTLDPGRWEAADQKLGRGRLAPENVGIEDGQLRLTLPADTLDGGQVGSKDLHGPGFYAARVKVPDAPSSITGFFLYNPPDLASEIDVEIYNDSSRKILFTTYAGGEQTRTETAELPFDPTQDFHDYAFSYDGRSVTFYADGEPMRTYEGGLPDRPMKLYINSWYPTWLDGQKPGSNRYAYVDWIEY